MIINLLNVNNRLTIKNREERKLNCSFFPENFYNVGYNKSLRSAFFKYLIGYIQAVSGSMGEGTRKPGAVADGVYVFAPG